MVVCVHAGNTPSPSCTRGGGRGWYCFTMPFLHEGAWVVPHDCFVTYRTMWSWLLGKQTGVGTG